MSQFRKIGKHIFSKESADKKTNNSFNSVYKDFVFTRCIILFLTFMAHGIYFYLSVCRMWDGGIKGGEKAGLVDISLDEHVL